MMLEIIPAIDIKDGKCVRLVQGSPSQCKVFDSDPVKVALHWFEEGARILHVIDLDGAFKGVPVNHEIVKKIVKVIPVRIHVGGGIRRDEDIKMYIESGVTHVIIGTRAITDFDNFVSIVNEYGDRIIVAVDMMDRKVRKAGWQAETDEDVISFSKKLCRAGVKTILCTDIKRDGTLKGINLNLMDELCREIKCGIIASGGVSSVKDIVKLLSLGYDNLIGVVVGMALYDGVVSYKELARAVLSFYKG